MRTVKTSTGQVYKLAGHRKTEYGHKAFWSTTCRSCGGTFEVQTPRIDSPTRKINPQMANDSGAWRRYYSIVRCPSCRKARRSTR